MSQDSRDGIERNRITQGSVDEPAPRLRRTPGVSVATAGVLALVVCVANFALGEVSAGVSAAIVGLLAFGAGLDWVSMDRRRIRQAERDCLGGHPAP